MNALLVALALSQPPAPAADFNRDVRPILAENCTHCHGPDPAKRAAGLRLDTEAGVFGRKRGPVVVRGKSHESELFERVSSEDPAAVMPPPDSNRKLTPAQVRTLRTWIDQGAKWDEHWAFRPLPASVPVPTPKLAGWARSPADAFVLARLEREGLVPAAEATKAAWLRRVTFDLTGLPPTPAELDAFERDPSPRAYEAVADRLLASTRYGERMAAEWLDLARYADTHGYQMDRARPVWPYRDWVIRAFNANQRYDEFLTDQLAGDLRPNATQSQRLATAFNRLHMQNEEGGIVEEEFRVAYVADRVNTMGTAALAMTFECCRCHDHKFDPLPTRDYYALFALFQNIDEAGQTPYFVEAMPVPTLALTTPADEARFAELSKAVGVAERELAAGERKARGASRWWRALRPRPNGEPAGTRFGFETPPDGKLVRGVESPKFEPGKIGRAVRLTGDNGLAFPGIGHFTRADPFTLALWLTPHALTPRQVVLHHSVAPVDAGSRGYDLILEDGRPAFGLYHMWPGDAVKVRAKRPLKAGEWAHVAATSDGSGRAAGLKLFVDGVPAELEVVRDHLVKDITYGGKEPDLALGHRFRDAGFKGLADELFVAPAALGEVEVRTLAGLPTGGDSPAWEPWFVARETAALRAKLAAARKALAAAREPVPEIMVMDELPTPKPAFILKRGAYDSPGDPVSPGTPGVLPPFPNGMPRNRLGLAKWLTHPDHPLTARVQVNRLWQQLFGVGLVETSDNFGTTGSPPTHPELLDWLARRTVELGWDTKATLRELVLSATYRQSSRVSPEARQRDPANALLSRGPSRRLTAEMLRDQALFVSGLLVEKQGGPSVFPYQPAGLWDEAMGRPPYPQSKGESLYRRSLYTVAKRTAPHPQQATFDAPDRSVCTARRQATTTPLQALATLNDPQMVEAARHLAALTLKAAPDWPGRVADLFRRVTGRAATAKEVALLVKLYEEQRAGFEADLPAAKRLLAVGDSKPTGDTAELAAATVLALAVLNHDGATGRK